jgi:serine/threonine protein kinase
LDQSSRNPSYRCAPNDVWSLGVILVNLTCGRNPWKQASLQDTTYRAFARNRNFLKTILPLSDELNEILGMIFESNPEDRITVSQLKRRIQHCSRFSANQQLPTPVASPTSSISDNGSLPESCATLSDIGSDSGYDSMESDSPSDEEESFEVDSPISSQRAAVAFAHPQTQQYVLPSQDIYGHAGPGPEKAMVPHPYMVHHTWIQSWFSNAYPFRQPQLAPQAFHPTPYPPYPSHFQQIRDVYVY